MKELTHAEVVAILKKRQRDLSLRQFALRLKVSPAYLSDIYNGKRTIGPSVLRQLKLQRVSKPMVTYMAVKK
jgi:transcriptional regulator with XRE-family HTH domain